MYTIYTAIEGKIKDLHISRYYRLNNILKLDGRDTRC